MQSTTSGLGEGHAFLYSNGKMTDLGMLPGGTQSIASGINDSGQVVGESQNISSHTLTSQAFRYSNGQMTSLPLDSAAAINDSGQIAGNGIPPTSSNGADQAALYSNGTVTYLGSFSSFNQFSVAAAINASGQVVGFSDSSSVDTGGPNTENAFLYSNGKMTDLGTLPGDSSSEASGINASGQVVGYSGLGEYGDSDPHAFLYSNGHMTALGTLPGDTYSIASGINSSGQVVGESYTGSTSRAFLYSNGKMIDLNSLLPANSGWELTDATAINDSGEIVGDGTINGQTHAFLLNLNSVSPPPPPAPPAPPPVPPASPAPPVPQPSVPPQDRTDAGVLETLLHSGQQLDTLAGLLLQSANEFFDAPMADANADLNNPLNPYYTIPILYQQLAAKNAAETQALYQGAANWLYWTYQAAFITSLDEADSTAIDPQTASSLITNLKYYAQQIQQNPLSGTIAGMGLMGEEAVSLGIDYVSQQVVGLAKGIEDGGTDDFTLQPTLPV